MDVIVEIFSCLPVKSLKRFSCVNKSFDALISDPYFVQKHLNKSKRNQLLTTLACIYSKTLVLTYSKISSLLQKSSTTIPYDRLPANYRHWYLVGSFNGLLCLNDSNYEHFYIWNPAIKSAFHLNYPRSYCDQFAFGFDTSTQKYKVVAFVVDYDQHYNLKSNVQVFTLGDDHSWRNIQCFPVLPLYGFNGVYLSGIINWLALRDYSDGSDDDDRLNCYELRHSSIAVEKYVILSLDLSTETYTQLLLPQGFDKVPRRKPTLVVLRDNLCFCHDFEDTYFVIWQMKDFGVQDSWIQLFKINFNNGFPRYYKNYQMELKCLDLMPVYLSENGDTLILADKEDNEAIIYNCRGNKVKHIGITDHIYWSESQGYVESLVWPHDKLFIKVLPENSLFHRYCNPFDEDVEITEREGGELQWKVLKTETETEGGAALIEGVEAT